MILNHFLVIFLSLKTYFIKSNIITHKKKYLFFIFLLNLINFSCKIKAIHHHLEFMEIVCEPPSVTMISQGKKMQYYLEGGLKM